MPITYVHDRSRRRLLVDSKGIVTIKDGLDLISEQDAIGAWSDSMLIDARGSDVIGFAGARIQAVVDHLRTVARGRKRGPIAVIADADRIGEMTQIYVHLCTQVSGLTVGVFRGQDEAEEWLEKIPLDPLDPDTPA